MFNLTEFEVSQEELNNTQGAGYCRSGSSYSGSSYSRSSYGSSNYYQSRNAYSSKQRNSYDCYGYNYEPIIPTPPSPSPSPTPAPAPLPTQPCTLGPLGSIVCS